ncbi:MAG: ATP-dependent RNA helicase RhlE [Pirellulaceae bacterium]|jgi:ATP-dependent RNA helicase RhlE
MPTIVADQQLLNASLESAPIRLNATVSPSATAAVGSGEAIQNERKTLKTFESMELFAPLNRALAEQNYTQPTPIQAQTIPPAIDGRDILGCAQTGTGKTAAFALPILDYIGHEKLQAAPRKPLVLVLAPTRELAIQISESFSVYGKHMKVRQALAYGGVNQHSQVNALRRGADVLIATPGRLLDLMEQGHIDLRDIEIFVLDEADRMLDMGFLPDLKKIIAKLPNERQSLFFSATMPPKIRELSSQLLHDPVSVDVTPKTTTLEAITQSIRMVERGNKFNELRDILAGNDVGRVIVFTRTKHGANALERKLVKIGLRTAALHGNKSQNARQNALEAFRRKEVTILVATDVAARGIDIDDVTHVINFDMPVEPESYVHRIGRTGRAGADGIAISFCTEDEGYELRAIEKLIDQSIRVENPEAIRTKKQSSSRKQHGAHYSGPGGKSKRPQQRQNSRSQNSRSGGNSNARSAYNR